MTSLLALVGIAADPLASREHVLLSNLVEHAWRAGRDLDLGTLIGEIQSPPLRKLGVFEIDQFFPPAERTKLAFTLNALDRLADLRRLGRGRGPRSADAALHGRWEATLRRRLPRAPLGRGAPVRRHARLLEARHVDARSGGNARPARARVHGRGLRLRPSERLPAAEEADPDHLQAGSCVRARPRPLDPEPRRPRLQGDVERRHVARRALADRERQGARAGRAPLGCRRHRCRRARPGDRRARQAPVPPRLGEGVAAAAAPDALGDVVPRRPADEGAGRAARAARRGQQPQPARRRDACRGGNATAARERRDRRRAARRDRRHGLVSRPGRAVVGRDRRGAGLDPAAGVPRRPRLAPLRRQRGRRRRAGGVRGRLRAARHRARPRERGEGRLRRPRLRRRSTRTTLPSSCPRLPSARSGSSSGPHARSSATSSTAARSSCSATAP